MTNTKKKQELEVIKNKTMLPAGFSADEIAADAGAGSQNVTAQDTATPLLNILQDNSPYVKKIDAKYIEGAAAGDIFNNVTNEIYKGDAGLTVVPCYFEKVFIEWRPKRGGFVALHPSDTPLKNQAVMKENDEGKVVPTLPNGNILTETNQHYVLMLHADGSFEPAVIPMVSTNLRTSRTWNTLIKKVMLQGKDGMFNPASFYCQYKLMSKGRQKDSYSWYVWHVETAGAVPSKAIYDAAKALEKSIAAGSVNVKHDVNEAEVMGVGAEDNDKM